MPEASLCPWKFPRLKDMQLTDRQTTVKKMSDIVTRVGQKYEKSYSNLAQMFSSVKFCAEQFSFSKLFDSRPSSFPKLHFYFYKGIHPKIQREILEF